MNVILLIFSVHLDYFIMHYRQVSFQEIVSFILIVIIYVYRDFSLGFNIV
jgi:hypothetical protein